MPGNDNEVKDSDLHRAAQTIQNRYRLWRTAEHLLALDGVPFPKGEATTSLSALTARNIARLKQEMAARTSAEDEKKSEVSPKVPLATIELEAAFEKTHWQPILRDITIEHATQYDQDILAHGSLDSRDVRRRQGEFINNNHTPEPAYEGQLFFSYNLSGKPNKTPAFLGACPTIISAKIGKMYEDHALTAPFTDLWYSPDFSQYRRNIHSNPIEFGSTKRWLRFSAADMTKTIFYQYADGHVCQRTIHFSAEVFSARSVHGMAGLFSSLFDQFMLELTYIGEPFRSYFLKHKNRDYVQRVFALLFPIEIYPEFKLPMRLVLSGNPYVETTKAEYDLEVVETLHEFIAADKTDEAINYVEANPALLNAYGADSRWKGLTPLLHASRRKNVILIEDLIDQGAEVSWQIYDKDNLLIQFLTGCVRLKEQWGKFITSCLAGIKSHCYPGISFHFSLAESASREIPLFKLIMLHQRAAKSRSLSVDHVSLRIEQLLAYHIATYNYLGLVALAYQRDPTDQGLLNFLLRCKADPSQATLAGKTLLMCAAERNDIAMLNRAHTEFQININVANERSETAAHYAAGEGNLAALRWLHEHSADLARRNKQGYTVLDLIDIPLARIHKKHYDSEIARAQAIKKFADGKEYLLTTVGLKSGRIVSRRSVGGIIKLTCFGAAYVLLVRRGEVHIPRGLYLGPGGDVESNESLEQAILRETFEETHLDLRKHPCQIQQLAQCAIQNSDGTYTENNLIYIDAGEWPKLPRIIAKDDACVAELVLLRDLAMQNATLCHRGVRIQASNALVLSALQQQKELVPLHEKFSAVLAFEMTGGKKLIDTIVALDFAIAKLYLEEGLDPSEGALFDALKVYMQHQRRDFIELLLQFKVNTHYPKIMLDDTGIRYCPLGAAILAGLPDDILQLLSTQHPNLAAVLVGPLYETQKATYVGLAYQQQKFALAETLYAKLKNPGTDFQIVTLVAAIQAGLAAVQHFFNFHKTPIAALSKNEIFITTALTSPNASLEVVELLLQNNALWPKKYALDKLLEIQRASGPAINRIFPVANIAALVALVKKYARSAEPTASACVVESSSSMALR